MDKAALDQFATTTQFVILNPYDAQQSSNLVAHLTASRVRQYPGGFGSADKSYMDLYNANGVNNPFFLYRATGTDDWYAEPNNIPEAGRSMAPAGVAVPLESVKRSQVMRRTSERDLKPVPCPCR